MILLLLFWLGASIGSFLNVVIWRMPRHESVSYPPSHCPTCNTRLRVPDLVPLLSQLYLRGQCRYCGQKFSWRYFGVELLTGCLFALVATQPGYLDGLHFMAPFIGDPLRLLRDLLFVATLVVISFVDFDTRLIQLDCVLLLGFAGLAYDFWRYTQGATDVLASQLIPGVALPAPIPASLLAMVVTAGVLALVRLAFSLLYRMEAMGFGDVMLAAAIAATLGWSPVLVTFYFLSVMLGAVVGMAVQIPSAISAYQRGKARLARYGAADQKPRLPLALARRAFRRAIMPFGPMLAVGALAALIYGNTLNNAYMGLFEQPGIGTTAPGAAPVMPQGAPYRY